jgi:hypothetical protein
VPPTDRFVPRFAAEPPQERLPYGRWAERLAEAFLGACAQLDGAGGDLGEPRDVGELDEIAWHPDRTYAGRTYVPASAPTSTGLELFGYVSFRRPEPGSEPVDLNAVADVTDETAARNPGWQLDLCDEVIGSWRGEDGRVAAITLVWGRALVGGGAIVTAELAGLAVDQCPLLDERFTLVGPDDYRSDYLEVALYDRGGRELARESLYEEDAQGG